MTFQNHTDCPLTDFGGKTSIFSHPVYLFLRKFSLQDSRGGSLLWLEKLADYQEGLAEPMQLASDPLSMRIYTPEECERLDASCRGFLLFLEQIQVLNLETREMVIERVLALDNAEFELDDLKWVILMVLFNIPGCENAYQQMEELLFEVNEGMLH
ncbi:DUF494 family protein [Escherichia coli]|uniref:DUF494 family protein n=1 Tax=Escherichia coli TaxID=562 RepID=UPI002875BA95|nr:DUF494 family protein [Escherichia coli]MDS1108212.1 DUF494 family protein [Escherichia coli]